MLWQLVHETSFFACLPESQKARCRLEPWHMRHTASFSAAGVPRFILFSGFLAGSFRCSVASPWQAWHMLPLASFFAPWWVIAMDACAAAWQVAQTGWA